MPSLIGNKPNQVSTNGDLGTLAFQDSNAVNISGGIVDVSAGTAALPTLGTTGDENTGVFFPAADTVAVSTNGTERMRITSAGNVGIGTSSPTFLSGGGLEIYNASNTRLKLTNSTTGSGSLDGLELQIGATDANIIVRENFPLLIYTNNAERMRIDSSGNLLVGITSARANAGDVQVSKGISFPATQSAQSDANTLDDYEEGSWTPSIGGNATYTLQTGTYTKIGRVVHLAGVLQINSFGTGSINTISGVPFAAANNTAQAPGSMTFVSAIATSVVSLKPRIAIGATTIAFTGLTAAGTVETDVISVFQNSARVDFQITYFV
jgi:hypothetical protein